MTEMTLLPLSSQGCVAAVWDLDKNAGIPYDPFGTFGMTEMTLLPPSSQGCVAAAWDLDKNAGIPYDPFGTLG